jgi:coenzyme PQQ precursor peptide PqqA
MVNSKVQTFSHSGSSGWTRRDDWYIKGEGEESLLMEWTTPQFEEICLNCEINTYASAIL